MFVTNRKGQIVSPPPFRSKSHKNSFHRTVAASSSSAVLAQEDKNIQSQNDEAGLWKSGSTTFLSQLQRRESGWMRGVVRSVWEHIRVLKKETNPSCIIWRKLWNTRRHNCSYTVKLICRAQREQFQQTTGRLFCFANEKKTSYLPGLWLDLFKHMNMLSSNTPCKQWVKG